jgi:hypothetical protein
MHDSPTKDFKIESTTPLQEAKLKLKEGRERRKDFFYRHINTITSSKETNEHSIAKS